MLFIPAQNVDEKIESSGQVSWRKDAFIDMLHHIKVGLLHRLSLCFVQSIVWMC